MQIFRKSKVLRSSVTLAVSIAVLMTAMAALLPTQTSAGPQDMSVRGYVWDSEYRDVEGASVVINIKDGETVRSTDSDTSDANGFYSVMFAAAEWEVGDTIEVIFTFESRQDTNWTTAIDATIQYVNMTFSFEIPEFGSLLGLALAAIALGVVGTAAVVVWKKK